MRSFKYKFFVFIQLFLLVISLNIVYAKKDSNKLPLFGKVITVDPGHGGRDPGTRYGKILEKDLNLEIAQNLEKQLISEGAIVYMTRYKDEDLSLKTDYRKKRSDLYRRIKLIENKSSDLYLSIHLNWYSDYYYGGVEILYNDINKRNKLLAENITKSFVSADIKTRSLTKTNLYLYRNTKVPGVLIECGFLSNKNDRYLLQQKEYQIRISNIIVKGIKNYLND